MISPYSRNYTDAERALVLECRRQGMKFVDIQAAHFPDRSLSSVMNQYYKAIAEPNPKGKPGRPLRGQEKRTHADEGKQFEEMVEKGTIALGIAVQQMLEKQGYAERRVA